MLEHEERGEGNQKPVPAEMSFDMPNEEPQQIEDAGIPPCPCILPTPAYSPEHINVVQCPSCGGPHEYVEVKPYSKSNAAWTHWYLCPNTGDPATLVITTDNNKTTMLRPDLLSAIIEAQQAGRYAFALFYVAKRAGDATPRLYRMWLHNDFPASDMPICAEWLQKDFAEKVGPPPQQQLPPAPTIKPLFKLITDDQHASN